MRSLNANGFDAINLGADVPVAKVVEACRVHNPVMVTGAALMTTTMLSLEYAMSIEMILAKLFKKALDEESTNAAAMFYICPVCGYTVRGKAPKKCPYCGVDEKKFMEIQ